jgi:excisionase family DNA binding protein
VKHDTLKIQPEPATPPCFLRVREAAELLRVSTVTLGRWRVSGRGPAFRKFGRRVLYALSDLLEWADDQRRLSTSEQMGRRK